MSLEIEGKDDGTINAKPIRVSATAAASTSTSHVKSDSFTGRAGTASRFVVAVGTFLFGTSASKKKAIPRRVDSESTSKLPRKMSFIRALLPGCAGEASRISQMPMPLGARKLDSTSQARLQVL
jgi:hypothetical protein